MPGKLWRKAISGGQRRLFCGQVTWWCQLYSTCCPLYIHFKAESLEEYARRIHDVHYEAFPFLEIKFGKDILARLPEEVRVFPEENGMDVSNNQE